MFRVVCSALVALGVLSLATPALSQGVQTGAVSGVVRDVTGAVLAQAAIHADSPALQGSRMTLTDQAGAYLLQGLPNGDYMIRVEFGGFQAVTSRVRVGVGAIERLNVTLRPAVNEAVTVTAPTPSLLTTRAGGSTARTSEIDRLPT